MRKAYSLENSLSLSLLASVVPFSVWSKSGKPLLVPLRFCMLITWAGKLASYCLECSCNDVVCPEGFKPDSSSIDLSV